MVGEWRATRFEELCEHSAFGPRFAGDMYAADGNVATLRTTDISADGRIKYDTMPLARLDLRKFQQHVLQPGDIVITRSGRIGTAALFTEFSLPVLPGAFLIRFRLKKDMADPLFYRYFFNSLEGQELLASVATGSVQQNINITNVNALDVPLPPLPEQCAIAHILGTLDDKIEVNRSMRETLEATARALFKSWFVDFDPVRAKMEGRDPGLSKHVADLFPDRIVDSDFGEIPEGWEVVHAGSAFDVAIGKTPPRKENEWFSTDPTDFPWMSIKDLGLAGPFISQVSEYLTPAAVERFRVRRIPDGIVVLSFKLTVGRVAITDGEMLSNEAIAHFLPREKTFLSAAYLYCYLQDFDYESLGSTSSIATAVNSSSVRAIPVRLPSREVHDEFQRATSPWFLRIRALQRESRTLAALRDALLPKLVSGELRIKDAESFVAKVST